MCLRGLWPGLLTTFLIECSGKLPVTKGVPQGSILGPTLFSIYISNIAQAVGSSLINLYADDTVLYSAVPSQDYVLNTLQQRFLSVQHSFSVLYLVLNTSKTKVMWFGSPHRCEYNLIQLLGSMARRCTVLLSWHISQHI